MSQKGGSPLPLTREKKELIIKELKDELGKSSSVVLTDYQGLNAKDISQLRNILKENDIKFKVYKNTLLKIAVKEIGLEGLVSNLTGCTSIAFGKNDALLPIKLLHRYSLDNAEKFKMKNALLEGQIFIGEQLTQIALLPGKEELLAKMLGSMKSPISSFVYVVSSPLSGLVNVLEQIRKKQSE